MNPLVSVVVPFYNTSPDFIREAVESVLSQTYENWELLLVDDGSDAPSTNAALAYAEKYPLKIRLLQHPDHQNLGASAARQLGVQRAVGKYIAFLDADDVWLPEKLEKQVTVFEAHPEAGMLYSVSRYWFSWTGDPKDRSRDYMPRLGIPPQTVIDPPRLLTLFLQGKASIPCPCSILVRRDLTFDVGGFVEEFRGVIDDQVFYAKICLNAGVLAMDDCLDYYRQHPQSTTVQVEKVGRIFDYHFWYLSWLSSYLSTITSQASTDYEQLWLTIRQELWYFRPFTILGKPVKFRKFWMWIKKWVLRVERSVLPIALQRSIWKRQAAEYDAVTAQSKYITRA